MEDIFPPRPIFVNDEGDEVIPITAEVYKVSPHRPRTAHELADVRARGPKTRILYSLATYDQAIDRAHALMQEGLPHHRIVFVLAERDIMRAFANGRFRVRRIAKPESKGAKDEQS